MPIPPTAPPRHRGDRRSPPPASISEGLLSTGVAYSMYSSCGSSGQGGVRAPSRHLWSASCCCRPAPLRLPGPNSPANAPSTWASGRLLAVVRLMLLLTNAISPRCCSPATSDQLNTLCFHHRGRGLQVNTSPECPLATVTAQATRPRVPANRPNVVAIRTIIWPCRS